MMDCFSIKIKIENRKRLCWGKHVFLTGTKDILIQERLDEASLKSSWDMLIFKK